MLMLGDEASLNGARILVTGGTGSFGRAFLRHVCLNYKPERFVVFSRDEMKQYEMAQEFDPKKYPFLRYFIGDVRDVERLEMAMRGIDTVIHAAALKHVPVAEYNPFECIHTNVIGAENVVRAAIRTKVRKVMALSTDKAANPVNLYGASKLAADKIFVAANALSVEFPRFSVVRYGNVMGSRGSVVPLFRRLINAKATHLPITDSRMTRFWISLDQGIEFVTSCMNMMHGGELFVPKIPSIRVVDLAEAMAPGMPIEIIGIRPGEKLHETLISEEEARVTMELADRYVVLPTALYDYAPLYRDLGATTVDEGFFYTSKNNPWWLDRSQVKAMLAATEE
ncbi:MAG: UDP-N-acetylglucosamine 4,6-dehydratase (inverting) [Magnetospirillum sp.]|nr:UDP-N-acetylglucosamine 4,6-dehydratase (inverting) [Magnetospirillum sp.]